MAGGVADRQKNRLAAALGLGQRLGAPGSPIDRIMLVLKEVGTGLASETIFVGWSVGGRHGYAPSPSRQTAASASVTAPPDMPLMGSLGIFVGRVGPGRTERFLVAVLAPAGKESPGFVFDHAEPGRSQPQPGCLVCGIAGILGHPLALLSITPIFVQDIHRSTDSAKSPYGKYKAVTKVPVLGGAKSQQGKEKPRRGGA